MTINVLRTFRRFPDSARSIGVVYLLHSGDSDYKYVGQADSFLQRFSQHEASSGTPKTHRGRVTKPINAVGEWLAGVGVENLRADIVFESDDYDERVAVEREYIARLTAAGYKLLNSTRTRSTAS